MAEDKISEKILEEAEREREAILEEAKKAAETRLKDAKTEVRESENKAKDEAKRLMEREREKILGLERIELRKALLDIRQNLIQKAFDRALKDVAESNAKDYLRIMKELLEATVDKGDATIVVGEREEKLDSRFIESLNKEKGWNLKLSDERRSIRGGFILVRGKVEINASLDFLIETAKHDLTVKVAEILLR